MVQTIVQFLTPNKQKHSNILAHFSGINKPRAAIKPPVQQLKHIQLVSATNLCR